MTLEQAILIPVVLVLGYLAIKILAAMIRGLGLYGQTIQSNGPGFFKEVWKSIITGAIGALIVAYFSEGHLLLSGGTGVGVALFTAFRGQA
jgi:hypothetical protein